MRYASILLVGSVSFFFTACGGGGDGGATADAGGGADSTDSATGGSGSGGRSGTEMVFTDLPGKIRFANFVSDGTAGVDLDFYWGMTIEDSELIGTIAYGEITPFMVPRRADFPLLDEDEAHYFAVVAGQTEARPAQFLVSRDEAFEEQDVLTVAFASVENFSGDSLAISSSNFYEHNLTVPPAGMAHVYVWANPFEQIDGGDFVLAGADALCSPDRGESGGSNLGAALLIPADATGLTLFDANTEPACDSGLEPVTETLQEGHSYVLIGEAASFDVSARRVVLLEVGLEN